MKSVLLEICMGTSCCLMGSQGLRDAVEALPAEKRRYIEVSEPSCLKGCRKSPSVRIDGDVHSDMTPDRLMEILKEKLA